MGQACWDVSLRRCRRARRWNRGRRSPADEDYCLAPPVAGVEAIDRIGRVRERHRAIDRHPELPRSVEGGELLEGFRRDLGDHDQDLLLDQRIDDLRFRHLYKRAEDAAAALAPSNKDQRALLSEYPPQVPERTIPDGVDDQVILAADPGEVVAV